MLRVNQGVGAIANFLLVVVSAPGMMEDNHCVLLRYRDLWP